ncbi:MAG: JAB domain-containing protein [Candidatus Pseudobacter hemicellulosilyticus]|uniref:JAB domain-containing protein n=1 Tax=Candidatus Pseudobacter hemicellulosilyticus TaxID=3121375 RepID=A0AAJ6BF20_9BACT|nr:MAG: JAB domain-containing protein [Pseudobacter sp.]
MVSKTSIAEIASVRVLYSPKTSINKRVTVHTSKDAYAIFLEKWDKDKLEMIEQLQLLLLNKANQVLGVYPLASGGINSVTLDIRLIFSVALHCLASAIILAHNHPCGISLPSETDITLTKQLKEAGKLIDIQVLDHLIITPTGYTSLSDSGYL